MLFMVQNHPGPLQIAESLHDTISAHLEFPLLFMMQAFILEAMQSWLSHRIDLDPSICHGKPVVHGTRILVANVVGAVAAGESFEEIIEDYPSLREEDIRACLDFAGNLTAMEAVEARPPTAPIGCVSF
jgi:uncharacterized protein (DUF433 family)